MNFTKSSNLFTKAKRENLDALLKSWQEMTGEDETRILKTLCLCFFHAFSEDEKERQLLKDAEFKNNFRNGESK